MSKRTFSQVEPDSAQQHGPSSSRRRRTVVPLCDCLTCAIRPLVDLFADPDFVPSCAQRMHLVAYFQNVYGDYDMRATAKRLARAMAPRLQGIVHTLPPYGTHVARKVEAIGPDINIVYEGAACLYSVSAFLFDAKIWRAIEQQHARKRADVFLSVLHPRVGAESSVQRACAHDLFARDVLRVVFAMMQ